MNIKVEDLDKDLQVLVKQQEQRDNTPPSVEKNMHVEDPQDLEAVRKNLSALK